MRFQAPRGTEDVLPDDAAKWQFLEREFASLAHRYGYREIRTPTFEDKQLFIRSSGETSEVVSKQMYDFLDKGGREIALKPEGTAPAMRALIEHSLAPPGTVQRLYYITPIFRYERPQKGRLREAHQVGLELVGSPSPRADAEIIEMTVRFYEAIGILNVQVSLNSLGRQQCRAQFREAILRHMEPHLKDKTQEERDRIGKNPLRLLDSKDPDVQSALQGLPSIHEFLEDESKWRLAEVQRLLTDAGVPFRIDQGIVRGLDYYTETVFEVQSSNLGSQNALCGGGRYDDLIREMGGSDTPSVGVAMGIERAIMVMEAEGVVIPPPQVDVFVVYSGDDLADEAAKLARELRIEGFSVLMDLDGKSMKSQLKQADRSSATYALIIGEDEMAAGTLTLRDLSGSTQKSLPRAEAIEAVRDAG